MSAIFHQSLQLSHRPLMWSFSTLSVVERCLKKLWMVHSTLRVTQTSATIRTAVGWSLHLQDTFFHSIFLSPWMAQGMALGDFAYYLGLPNWLFIHHCTISDYHLLCIINRKVNYTTLHHFLSISLDEQWSITGHILRWRKKCLQ